MEIFEPDFEFNFRFMDETMRVYIEQNSEAIF
jgi:hypothetical protein